jgi:hypothetical protein
MVFYPNAWISQVHTERSKQKSHAMPWVSTFISKATRDEQRVGQSDASESARDCTERQRACVEFGVLLYLLLLRMMNTKTGLYLLSWAR